MARSTLFLLLLLLTSMQLGAQSFHVISRNLADSVVLRWAPVAPTTWQRYNTYGYRVERLTIDGSTNAKTPSQRIGPDTIRPWTLDRFVATFPKDHAYAGPVVQLLYGETSVKNASAQNMASVQDASTELTMRYSFTLLMADMDASIAQALGLRFADHDVEANAQYLYRVITLDPEHRDTAIVGVNRSLGAEEIPLGPTLHFDEEEKQVRLKWEKEVGDAQFSAFWVERADVNGPWERLHSTPYVPTIDKDKPSPLIYFSDTTMERNYVPHRYRILGITSFGELSPDAPIITAMGRDRTPPEPPFLSQVKDENGRLVVHWEQAEQASDLKGYRVEKAPTALGGHLPLHTGLLPKNTFALTDTSSFLAGENHYQVAAVDTAGNASFSNAGYGSLIDSVAPAAPFGIAGVIDTTGLVTLHWPLGKEPDLLGYRVFFANAPDHEFNNVTPYPVADTLFRDTLQINTLTKRIYYRVVAVDLNYNHSAFSAMLVLTRPDIVPPVAPVFSGKQVSDTSVVLRFVPSGSEDLAFHRLSRKDQEAPEWTVMAQWPAGEKRREYTDHTVIGPGYYSYSIEAVDSAGNSTSSPGTADVRVHQHLRHEGASGLNGFHDPLAKAVQLNWDKPAGAVKHYVIYRAKDGGTPIAIGSVDGTLTGFEDNRLMGKGAYDYQVQAVLGSGATSGFAHCASPIVVP